MGSCALIIAIIFLIIEAKYEQFSCVGTRKRIVLADLITSLAASFLFIITTFTLWTKYSSLELEENYNGRSAKFAVLFSFLSAIVWVNFIVFQYFTNKILGSYCIICLSSMAG